MNRILTLGPGSGVPEWLDALDARAFGQAWGPLGDHECILMAEGIGFARWSAQPVLGEAELLRIVVSPAFRRQGTARHLLRASHRVLVGMGIQVFHLEVRVSNLPARTLYEAEGWRFQGIRRAYYRDGEDAALYCLGGG
nr:GNAT family N-acetyltransferase [uncultured Holophaga sp.]